MNNHYAHCDTTTDSPRANYERDCDPVMDYNTCAYCGAFISYEDEYQNNGHVCTEKERAWQQSKAQYEVKCKRDA